jgi:CRP-like cAMP-binding protein
MQALWRETLVDAAVFREWILNVGRRDAVTRLAHLFAELETRCSAAGLTNDEGGFSFPVTHQELAEALGVTNVHVSRTLQELRKTRLIDFRKSVVRIPDKSALEQRAGFSPQYLFLAKDA